MRRTLPMNRRRTGDHDRMGLTHVFAGVPVRDHTAAVDWYARLLGRAPDLLPHATESAWQLTDTGWIAVVEDGARAGSAQHTVLVDDLGAELAALAGRGLEPGTVETYGSGARKAEFCDPDGNRIGFAQA
jgi:catechol 2,3-dioxygenase-like lactoylglutathione lyase family enzyme